VAQRKSCPELPIKRFGRVDEVTPTAVLLASADGSYYVGQPSALMVGT
jgi:NAD(P)-dependent dehydrogenase (short-subunit alcohol dehydrogenase family)